MVEFTSNKLKPYVYKVTPDTSPRGGEYAFVAASGVAGTASTQVAVYDFGIDE